MSEHGRGQGLQAKGATLCELTEELVHRSRRALERSRALLGDSHRIMGRTEQQR